MSEKSNIDVIKLLPDQELFNLLGSEVNDSVEQELKDRGYSETEIKESLNKNNDKNNEDQVLNKETVAHEEQSSNSDGPGANVNTNPENDELPSDEGTDTPIASKKKLSKKKIIILSVIAVAAIIVAVVFLRGYEFNKVKSRVVQIAGGVVGGNNYFRVDTYPDEYENMDQTVVGLLKGNTQEKALDAIKYANEALGFNGSLYNDMLSTTALMGRQSEENSKYKVTWTYHPDDGLEVTYERK